MFSSMQQGGSCEPLPCVARLSAELGLVDDPPVKLRSQSRAPLVRVCDGAAAQSAGTTRLGFRLLTRLGQPSA